MMECERVADEQLRADKMDLLYGEADAAARKRVESHLAGCDACREEMEALRRLRQDLQAWTLPAAGPAFSPRGLVVPRWLAVAAALLIVLGGGLGAAGYFSVRRALAVEKARAVALEQRQQQATLALAALAARPAALDAEEILARLDGRVDGKIEASEERQRQAADLRFARWSDAVETQRRLDLARVAAGLSYLDARHGEQVARTSEVMGYVLEAAAQKR
jgi:anti-sigma factor RsiW